MIDGKRPKVVRATKKETQKALRDLMREGERGKVADANQTVNMAVRQYRERTLASKNIAPSTREVTHWALGHITDTIGSKRLRTLTVRDVEKMLDRLADGSRTHAALGRESLSKIRGTLGRVLDDAIRRGDVDRNVARLAVLPPGAARTAERRSLTPDQFRKLLSACEGERLGAMFVLMLGSGVRPGEAAGLRWSALDLDAGTMAIRSARRKGERGAVEVVDDLKTRQSRRTLGLPSFVVEALRAHRKAQNAERLAASQWSDDDLVFATTRGSAISHPTMGLALTAIAEKAGIGKLSPNELRHTHASVLVDAGESLDSVAQRLGHTTTRMVELTYRHAVRPSIDHGVLALENLVADG